MMPSGASSCHLCRTPSFIAGATLLKPTSAIVIHVFKGKMQLQGRRSFPTILVVVTIISVAAVVQTPQHYCPPRNFFGARVEELSIPRLMSISSGGDGVAPCIWLRLLDEG